MLKNWNQQVLWKFLFFYIFYIFKINIFIFDTKFASCAIANAYGDVPNTY